MGPVENWSIFILIVGGLYYFYFHKKPTPTRTLKRAEEVVINTTKGSALYLGASGAGSGNEVAEKKKKKPAKKPAKPQSVPAPKIALSSDGSDDEAVQEEDPRESIKRLHALKSGQSLPNKAEASGSKPESSTARARQIPQKKQSLAPKSPLATASQASSTGADADIDEEGSTPLNTVSGDDPSDMLEKPAPGPRVMTINPSTQPTRQPKAKKEAAPEPGTQSKKNQKKKEKAKAAREEELAMLRSNREQYRAVQKAEEAKSQRGQPPAPVPQPDSAWTTVNGKSAKKTTEPTTTVKSRPSDLLDTFEAQTTSYTSRNVDSDEEPQTHPSNLDASHWEEVPAHVREEGEWNTVGTKKTKEKTKPILSSESSKTATQEQEIKPRKQALALPTGVPKATPIIRNKSVNGFEALSGDSAVSTRSSDWAEVDAWDVHPQ